MRYKLELLIMQLPPSQTRSRVPLDAEPGAVTDMHGLCWCPQSVLPLLLWLPLRRLSFSWGQVTVSCSVCCVLTKRRSARAMHSQASVRFAIILKQVILESSWTMRDPRHATTLQASRPVTARTLSSVCVSFIVGDRLCGLVVRVPGYRSRFFWEVVGLERGPLSLVSALGRKSSGSGPENENTAVGFRHADHVSPSIRKKLALTSPTSGSRSIGLVRSRSFFNSLCVMCPLLFV
jgi:hypothetical protein